MGLNTNTQRSTIWWEWKLDVKFAEKCKINQFSLKLEIYTYTCAHIHQLVDLILDIKSWIYRKYNSSGKRLTIGWLGLKRMTVEGKVHEPHLLSHKENPFLLTNFIKKVHFMPQKQFTFQAGNITTKPHNHMNFVRRTTPIYLSFGPPISWPPAAETPATLC